MWFVGLIVGAVIGAAVEDLEGAFYGALLGALAGYALRLSLGRNVELRLRELERQLQELRTALEQLRSGAGQPSARPAPAYAGFELPTTPVGPGTPISIEPAAAAPAEPESLAAAAATSARPGTAEPAATLAPGLAPQPSAGGVPPSPPTEPPHADAVARPAWWRWLMGGNTVVRAGVIVLFFGVAFLLKYAYDHTQIPVEVRLTAVAAGAIALLGLGWRLRAQRPGYALALQGAGIGVLYLTVFAALRLFGLLPPGAAFALLCLIAALSAALAVMQGSQSLAILGASGGFLAPILTSTGGGSHVMLFSYYALLNAGILAIAWYKAWRPLNLVGFAFTFGIGSLWGARYYVPELYASTQPFLALFFLMYLAIPLLFAQRKAGAASEDSGAASGNSDTTGRKAGATERYLDATLVFGVPVIAFGMQLRLAREFEYGAAYSAVVVSLVYLSLARVLYVRRRDQLRMLVEAFLALGVVFATLAVPLALDGRWTAAAWALEGAALVWAGVRQRRWPVRAFGLLLQLGAGLAFLAAVGRATQPLPVLNSVYLGCVLVALAGLFSNWWLARHRDVLAGWERGLAAAAFWWGLAWWAVGGLAEIERHALARYAADLALLFLTGSALAFGWLRGRIDWRLALYPALALVPVVALVAGAGLMPPAKPHPLAALGVAAWPLAFAAHLWLMRRFDKQELPALDVLHAAGLWLLAALSAWEVGWQIDRMVQGASVWRLVAWALVPATLLGVLALRGERIAWPVRARLSAYLLLGAAPLAAFLWCWVVVVNLASNGDPAPLPYVPLTSPLDLAQVAALLVLVLWAREVRRLELIALTGERLAALLALLGAAAFVAANGVLLRSLHHFAGVEFGLWPMWHSMLVQAALSIFWSALALAITVAATRLRLRALWIVGAALMAVVVAKLFLVDLSSVRGVERIVSFIGVGLLMLVVGYFSPVPPRARESAR
jgi:uncharacterized membrane protein